MKFNLFALDLNIAVQGRQIGSKELDAGAKLPDRCGSANVDALKILREDRWSEDSHETRDLHVLIIEGESKHLKVLEGAALQERFGKEWGIYLLIEHRACEDS